MIFSINDRHTLDRQLIHSDKLNIRLRSLEVRFPIGLFTLQVCQTIHEFIYLKVTRKFF